jgi:SagB-type dehydrogenase family enzyme
MKKILILTLVVAFSFCGAQAQKKNTGKNTAKNTVTNRLPSDDGTFDDKAISLETLETIELPMSFEGLHTPLIEAMKERRTIRNLKEEDLPMELISCLLWSAYGYNRPDEQKRVVPSAVNVQEFDIYLFTREGIYLYDAEKNAIHLVVKGDHRKEISQQKHFAIAPVSIVMVANYDRMGVFKKVEDRDFYAAVDAGYISQNIYLFCSSAKLGTVACGGIDRDTIHKLLQIKNGRAILAHPVGMQ